MEAEAREMGAEGEESERPAGEEEEGGIVRVRKPWGRRLLGERAPRDPFGQPGDAAGVAAVSQWAGSLAS